MMLRSLAAVCLFTMYNDVCPSVCCDKMLLGQIVKFNDFSLVAYCMLCAVYPADKADL